MLIKLFKNIKTKVSSISIWIYFILTLLFPGISFFLDIVVYKSFDFKSAEDLNNISDAFQIVIISLSITLLYELINELINEKPVSSKNIIKIYTDRSKEINDEIIDLRNSILNSKKDLNIYIIGHTLRITWNEILKPVFRDIIDNNYKNKFNISIVIPTYKNFSNTEQESSRQRASLHYYEEMKIWINSKNPNITVTIYFSDSALYHSGICINNQYLFYQLITDHKEKIIGKIEKNENEYDKYLLLWFMQSFMNEKKLSRSELLCEYSKNN